MVEDAPDESRGLLFAHVQANKTIPGMAQLAPVKIRIEREERDATQMEQIGDDLTILDPLHLSIKADLADRDAPSPKKLSLAFGDVLIEDVHAGTGSSTYSEAVYSGA